MCIKKQHRAIGNRNRLHGVPRIFLWGLVAYAAASCARRDEWQAEGVGEFRDVAVYWSVADPVVPMAEAMASGAGKASQWSGALAAWARYGDALPKAGSTPATPLEDAVRDLNVFLVHTSLGDRDVRYFYFDKLAQADGTPEASRFPLKLTHLYNGSYRVYAVANNGAKLYTDAVGTLNQCTLTEAEVKRLKTESGNGFRSVDGGLLMSTMPEAGAVPVMDLTAGADNAFGYEMRLVRRVARLFVDYNNNDPQFEAKYIEMHNVPLSIAPFDSETQPTDYGLMEVVAYPSAGGRYGPAYVLENKQFYVGAPLHSDQDRTGEVAPPNASYWFVDGDYNSERTGYQIYVGDPGEQNPLENFELHSNRTYEYALTIQGNLPSDKRVSTFSFGFKEKKPVSPGVLTQEIEVSYANQFQNNFTLYYADNTSLSVSNPHNLQVEYKYSNEPDKDYVVLTEKKPVAIGTEGVSSEQIQLTLRYTYKKGGVLRINYAVYVVDKYARSAIRNEEI